MADEGGERSSRKRRKKDGDGKLLEGEHVEVRFIEEGLKGSWHPGVVIGGGVSTRLIEYDEMMNDDNSSKLIESVTVSAAIEGVTCTVSENHRGNLRPTPPLHHTKRDEIRYGVCVDALVDDAWWEGVVFDHTEGSSERLVFFPDQGDQQIVSVNQMRLTFDWNEVSGDWKARGDWMFLKVLQTFEQKEPLLVSVRQIWYDVRCCASFGQKIREWIFGSLPLWHELVSDAIKEIVSVTLGLPVAEAVLSSESVDVPFNVDDIDMPLQTLPSLMGSDFQLDNSGLAVGISQDLETCAVMNHYSSECVESLHHRNWVGRENYGVGSSTLEDSGEWALPCPIRDELTSIPGYCPQVLSDFISEHCHGVTLHSLDLKRRYKIAHENAKRHLLAVGWVFKKNGEGIKYYVSPDGEHHDSFIKACKAWQRVESQTIVSCVGKNENLKYNDQFTDDKKQPGHEDNEAHTDFRAAEPWQRVESQTIVSCVGKNENLKYNAQFTDDKIQPGHEDNEAHTDFRAAEPWQPVDIEAEYCPDAITYYALGSEGEKPAPRLLGDDLNRINATLKAKRHLLALGWKIEKKRHRVRYSSPDGKKFYSLSKICNLMVQIAKEHKSRNYANDISNHSGCKLLGSVPAKIHPEPATPAQDYAPELYAAKEYSTDERCLPFSKLVDSDALFHSSSVKVCSSKILKQGRQIDRDSSWLGIEDTGLHVFKREVSVDEVLEPKYCPDAIIDYIKFINLGEGKGKKRNMILDDAQDDDDDVKLLRLNAKNHLLSVGWKIWFKLKRGRYEARFGSASRKTFYSLYTACKAYMEEENFEISTSMSHEGLINSKLEGLSTSQNFKDCTENNSQLKLYCPSTSVTHDDQQETGQLLQEGINKGSVLGSNLSDCQELVFSKLCARGMKKIKKKRSTASFISSCNRNSHKSRNGKIFQPLVQKHNELGSSLPGRVLRSSKRARQVTVSSGQQVARTVLSWLIDNNVVLPRQKVRYLRKRDGHVMMEGRITRNGIKCHCCKNVFTLSNFGAHAGSNNHRPTANIFLQDGRSLLQCQMEILERRKSKDYLHRRTKSDYSIYQSDNICSVCQDGGSLVLCDHCPSSYHLDCVGLKDVPEGKWFCPSCCCGICGLSEFNSDNEQFTEETILYCDQCEHEYHVGCLRKRGMAGLTSCPKGNWLCSKTCSKIFFRLRKLLGKSNPTAVDGFSWTILRSSKENGSDLDTFDRETMTEYHSKLSVALDVLHECFVTIIEPRTSRDLVEDLLSNKESELNRLNFWGFYTMLLEKGDELISVATFRVFGEKVAEMPLVGTRVQYRRKGMCRLLMDELEKLLSKLGVEKLLLPAVPQLLETWTTSFGFTKMTSSERLTLSEYNILSFQETTMCQKFLVTSSKTIKEPKGSHNILSGMSNEEVDYDNFSTISEMAEMVQPTKTLPSSGVETCSSPGKGDTAGKICRRIDSARCPDCSSSDLAGVVQEANGIMQSQMTDRTSVEMIQPSKTLPSSGIETFSLPGKGDTVGEVSCLIDSTQSPCSSSSDLAGLVQEANGTMQSQMADRTSVEMVWAIKTLPSSGVETCSLPCKGDTVGEISCHIDSTHSPGSSCSSDLVRLVQETNGTLQSQMTDRTSVRQVQRWLCFSRNGSS